MDMDDEKPKTKKRWWWCWCCKKGPCGCLGISLGNATKFFVLFDLVTGLLVFIPALVLFLQGEEEQKEFYITEKFKVPREVIIFLIFAGIYTVLTTSLLVLSSSCRNMGACYAWLILNLPFACVNPIKLYESIVVYWLAQEIMEQDQALNFFFDQVAGGGSGKKEKKKKKSADIVRRVVQTRMRSAEDLDRTQNFSEA